MIPVLTDLCHTMKWGSLCALGGFAPYPVMSALTHWPEDFTARAAQEAAMSVETHYLAVFTSDKTGPRWRAWYAMRSERAHV